MAKVMVILRWDSIVKYNFLLVHYFAKLYLYICYIFPVSLPSFKNPQCMLHPFLAVLIYCVSIIDLILDNMAEAKDEENILYF